MKKSNVVKIVIGCIVILLIIGIISIIALTNNKQTIDIEENYLLLKQDNRYGVIDKNGSIIIEPQYEMIQIPNPEKPVFVCLFDYNNDTMEYKTKVLNDKMEQIYTTFSDINAIQIKNNTEKYSYQTQVLKYKENDKYGILSIDGKKITDAKYDEIESIAYKSNILAVKQNDKYGVINITGKTIANCEYDTISADYYYNDNSKYEYAGYIVSVKTDNGYRYGYIKYDGKVLLKPEYTQIERIPLEEEEKQIYLIAYKDGQAGLIKNKSIVLDHEYESIEYNGENNVLTIGRARKYGVTDLKGKIILPLEYDEIDVVGNCIRTTKNQENKIFDINGNEQGNVDYINIINTDSQYKVVVNSENKFAIINEKNEKIIDYNYDYIEYLFGEYFIVTSNEKVGIIILISHYLSNFILGCFFRKTFKHSNMNEINYPIVGNFGSIFVNAIKKGIETILLICGIITIFLMLSSIFTNLFDFNIYNSMLVKGIFEITIGIEQLSKLPINMIYKAVIASCFLAFGGLSVHMQVISQIVDTDIKYHYFLIGRIWQMIISGLITYFICLFLFPI